MKNNIEYDEYDKNNTEYEEIFLPRTQKKHAL